MAARPATLWAAVSPVVVGAALAEWSESLRPGALAATLIAAVAMQVGANIANDVADAATGADNEGRIGPPRAVASGLLAPRQAWIGVGMAFAIAGMAAVYLVSIAGWVVLAIGVAAVAGAIGYTSGPRYGYHGLGEVSVFIFFGLIATVGSRFVHDRSAPVEAWVMGAIIGLLITAILVANNLRDIESDETSGKYTLAVRLGRQRTRWLFAACLVGAFGTTAIVAALGVVPAGAALGLLVAPGTLPLLRTTFAETAGPPLIGVLIATSRLQAAFALLSAVGIIVTKG